MSLGKLVSRCSHHVTSTQIHVRKKVQRAGVDSTFACINSCLRCLSKLLLISALLGVVSCGSSDDGGLSDSDTSARPGFTNRPAEGDDPLSDDEPSEEPSTEQTPASESSDSDDNVGVPLNEDLSDVIVFGDRSSEFDMSIAQLSVGNDSTLIVQTAADSSAHVELAYSGDNSAALSVRTVAGMRSYALSSVRAQRVAIRTGPGNDRVSITTPLPSNGFISINTFAGDDFVRFKRGLVSIETGSGNDTIIYDETSTTAHVVNAGEGNDRLVGPISTASGGAARGT